MNRINELYIQNIISKIYFFETEKKFSHFSAKWLNIG